MIATESFVKETFDRFNDLYFEGKLPPVPIVLVKARSFLGKLEYMKIKGLFGLVTKKWDFRMKISRSFDLDQATLEDVILHEMIHYYIDIKGIRDTSAHGKVFRSMMNDFNSRFGRHITIRYKCTPIPEPGQSQSTTES